MAEALTVIQDNHVDGSKVKYDEVFKSSIIGMLRTLDPHSNFYDAKEFEEQRADWRSEYYGIGATIGDRKIGGNTDTYILATFESTPAYRAGLRFGDKITEIDGKPVKGKASGEVRDMLRGPRGTTGARLGRARLERPEGDGRDHARRRPAADRARRLLHQARRRLHRHDARLQLHDGRGVHLGAQVPARARA